MALDFFNGAHEPNAQMVISRTICTLQETPDGKRQKEKKKKKKKDKGDPAGTGHAMSP